MNSNLIETYYKLNFKFDNRNIIKNGYSQEDLFHNKIIELLEMKYDIEDELEGLVYIAKYFRTRKRNYKEPEIIINEHNENYEEKINLLFIDYRPTKKL